jgi:hypothetical protein
MAKTPTKPPYLSQPVQNGGKRLGKQVAPGRGRNDTRAKHFANVQEIFLKLLDTWRGGREGIFNFGSVELQIHGGR